MVEMEGARVFVVATLCASSLQFDCCHFLPNLTAGGIIIEMYHRMTICTEKCANLHFCDDLFNWFSQTL